MSTCPSRPAIIAGVGPGTGASVARKFAQQYPVILMARNPDNYTPIVEEIEKKGGWARGISVDVSDAGSVERGFEEVGRLLGGEDKGGKVAAAVFNVGGRFIRKPFLELTQEEFEAGWDANGFPRRLPLHPRHPPPPPRLYPLFPHSSSPPTPHPPTLIFTSATAALKGSANCASFATGKFALRALAQSLAREFGPKGVHVAHAVIDGVIDIPRTKGWKVEGEDAKISADAIADAYWYLHTQPRTTFTNEIDIRPYVEKW
ncbi:protein arginine N-methyltransferase skb1 [Physcia stellaris]|nr:protein arginine N-methyltransferase skb1 [Physcia stellaris]